VLKQLIGHGLAIGNSASAAGVGPCHAAQRCSEVLSIVNIDAMTIGLMTSANRAFYPLARLY
jgi:hypothetical protein